MPVFVNNEPLSDAEWRRLTQFLKNCKSGKAMNIEELDGFFSALIAGLEVVMPREYLPEVFGSETPETHQFESIEEADKILGLMMRHWNHIAGTLFKDEVYLPLLLEDENGVAHANDWARGFIRGTHMRHEGWAELLADDDHGGCMIPMLALYHEHDKNPDMRPKPIGAEQRERLIRSMAAGLVAAYRYFRQQAPRQPSTRVSPARNAKGKVGRNNPCPCGSGKKYKRCCGAMTVN